MARRLVSDDCPLTDQQARAVVSAMRGLSYKQIGRDLGITESGVGSLMKEARQRLGIVGWGRGVMFALMLDNDWVRREALLADYKGLPYVADGAARYAKNWLPSPAQRLYLDAFDRLLRERTDEAAADVDFYFGVMCRAASCPDRRRDSRDVDAMLLGMARALSRPLVTAPRLAA